MDWGPIQASIDEAGSLSPVDLTGEVGRTLCFVDLCCSLTIWFVVGVASHYGCFVPSFGRSEVAIF